MTEQELRALVRDVIAKQGAGRTAGAPPTHHEPMRTHVSHTQFSVAAGAEGDGVCIIEPAVACNHCGYCKSLGH